MDHLPWVDPVRISVTRITNLLFQSSDKQAFPEQLRVQNEDKPEKLLAASAQKK